MSKNEALKQLLGILHECNMANAIDSDGHTNDFPHDASWQRGAYGHVSKAIEALGGIKYSNHYAETGDIHTAMAAIRYPHLIA